MNELERLATFSDAPAPAVTRVVYSETDLRAREYVKGLCAAAGLRLREDAVGNIFARWEGREPELPAVATGSHIDAIPNAGAYDGTVGVLGGLEAIRMLQRAGARPRRSLELVVFCAEEPTRFGIGCFGSRLLAGTLDGAQLRDKDGRTLNAWRSAAGFGGDVAEVTLPSGYYSAFVELHIEQGPLLERAGIPLGIVTAIAAPASLRLWIEGEGGHAGAVLMAQRRDAFCAAAEIVLAEEAAAKATGAPDTVATAGICEVFPGAINSIPSRVRLELDVRDIVEARRDTVLAAIDRACEEIAARRGVTVRKEVINIDAPTGCDALVVDALTRAAEHCGLAYQKMVSRAYHDSLFMSRIAPTAMLFIPCRGGVSHRPDEYAAPEAIAAGARVLSETLSLLADL
ncbi:MAG TPA: M20 family metallo-hydrolase [Candidatus Sulfopaludibacter sp.]|nr:M20 family metallo-hydrolase [Candidatus Sulfopaludibacter sp.]